MRQRRFGFLLSLALSSTAAAGGAPPAARLCSGDYSDNLTVLARRVRDFERDPQHQYSYCLRTAAIYECLSYSSDGSVRRSRKTVTAHGTGFAWRRLGGETFLLTNDHVATWPAVTDEEHPVDEVPMGCKRLTTTVRIVDDENDGYEANDIPLTLVVTDPLADAAILKTRTPLRLIPYRTGKSASLRVGNVVAVRGFPLGVFAATNIGKVVNAIDHDTDQEWDHLDFVVDAQLSAGNSGSPVLAVSCKTGEYELVGVYHAGYVHGSALNIVVGVDQLHDLMSSFKASIRHDDPAPPLAAAERALLLTSPSISFLPFGPLTASVRAQADGALWFEVYSRNFPRSDERLIMFEDPPQHGQPFGNGGRIYLGNRRGLRMVDRNALDADSRGQLERVLGRLRGAAVATARFRSSDAFSQQGEARRKMLSKLRERQSSGEREAALLLGDLSERLGPRFEDQAMTALQAVAPPEHGTPARVVTSHE